MTTITILLDELVRTLENKPSATQAITALLGVASMVVPDLSSYARRQYKESTVLVCNPYTTSYQEAVELARQAFSNRIPGMESMASLLVGLLVEEAYEIALHVGWEDVVQKFHQEVIKNVRDT